jgi:fatty acid desaturase
MLSKEDSRRLAQLERQLRRDDPEFCVRMTGGLRARRRVPLSLAFVAVVIWIAALVLGVVGWWIAAAIAALCATVILVRLGYRARPSPHATGPGPLPPVW